MTRFNTTSSSLEFYNGTNWISTNLIAVPSIQVFATAGTFTYTKPANVRRVRVFVTGGGGGGGPTNDDDMANGGGAGGTAIKMIDLTGVSTVSVTVGTGSAGASNNSGFTGRGATSSFGAYCSATGGRNTGADAGSQWAIGGEGGVGTGGDINLHGGDGIGGAIDLTSNLHAAGTGGSSYWGGGGAGDVRANSAAHPRNGQVYGSGGGGGASSQTSGSGATGVVIVEEYE
jgi:hypothetical protein